jgi:hypothetical protein
MVSRAVTSSFAMIAGINFAGYQTTSSRDTKNINARSEVNISSKIIELFGSSGVSAGASFLEKLMAGSEHSQV